MRVDANGAWSVDEAGARCVAGRVGLEYAEQPCASVEELGALRGRIGVPVAVDEGLRRARTHIGVRAAGVADVVVLKVAATRGGPGRPEHG